MAARTTALLLSTLCAVFLVACGGDDVAGDETSTNNGTDIREEQPTPDTMPCNGCKDGDGNCVAGTSVDACGAGGVTCAECGPDQMCNAGACEDPEPQMEECTPDNCPGCCNAEGRCVAGGLDAACGIGGTQCVQCGPGTDCTDGACVSTDPDITCGPDNCNGCCNAAGTCVAGSADNACGAGGGACSACAADQNCEAGACVADPDPDPDPEPCADTCAGCCDGETCITAVTDAMCGASGTACISCGADQTCNAGTGVCDTTVVTPTGDTWDLYLVSADIPVFSAYGYEWDALSPPDTFLEAYAENANGYWYNFSSTRSDNYDPVWNEMIFSGLDTEALADGVIFWFQDEDVFGPEEICYHIVMVDSSTITGQDIVTTCADEPDMNWTWRLEPTPAP